MLGRYEFKILSHSKQLAYLLENGTYLIRRHYLDYEITLFYLGTYFVEAWYDGDINEVTRISSFTSINGLNAYTKLIKLDLE